MCQECYCQDRSFYYVDNPELSAKTTMSEIYCNRCWLLICQECADISEASTYYNIIPRSLISLKFPSFQQHIKSQMSTPVMAHIMLFNAIVTNQNMYPFNEICALIRSSYKISGGIKWPVLFSKRPIISVFAIHRNPLIFSAFVRWNDSALQTVSALVQII